MVKIVLVELSYPPGAYHASNSCWVKGKDTGIKNLITATYKSNNLRVNIENKPFRVGTERIRYTAFNLKFDDGVLKDYNKASPSELALLTKLSCKLSSSKSSLNFLVHTSSLTDLDCIFSFCS